MTNEQKMAFGAEIRARRKAKGWNQQIFAGKVRVTPTSVSRWENGKNEPQPDAIGRMIDLLGFSEEYLLSAFNVRPSTKKRNSQYSAVDYAAAAVLLGSFERLDEACCEIWDEWPVPEEPNEYGTASQWIELYRLSPESGGVLFHRDDGLVGFWHCLVVVDETYDRILSGENVNQTLSPEDVVPLGPTGTYKLYFAELFLRRKNTSIAAKAHLLRNFTSFLREAADAGIFFDRISAIVTGVEVKRLCQDFRFRKVGDHNVHRYYDRDGKQIPAEIFELEIGPEAERLFSHDPEHPELVRLYSEAGFFDRKS